MLHVLTSFLNLCLEATSQRIIDRPQRLYLLHLARE